ncbi:VOC family protein [Cryobacterium sp. PH31-AA6]|uniref:bleomycin resistance protein n=1 Tax=Cryobacterium sp. PH31-AA6 TaxID=3046205 RepID=UPI0024BAF56E|nr:VOC family protein [Cryobacterium sp. PH31-AA6]MDJ0324231.1 VOC family protein [Cryobacterium sp. PH31-AA6]
MMPAPNLVSAASATSTEDQEVSHAAEVVADADSTPGPGLVPELLITSLEASLDFWCRLCEFEVLYDRPDEWFAYITSGMAHIMLEQRGSGRNWIPAPLEPPLGRGINFQITVASIQPLLSALDGAGWALFMEPETKWYRTGTTEAGVAQFLVQDPDGYLIRFQASLGRRLAAPGTL